MAKNGKRETPRPWRQPCAVIASGPSLAWDNYADVELIRQAGIKTIAVNNSWEVARFCDVIYAGDGVWWKHNHKDIDISAERWALSRSAVNLYGCQYRGRVTKDGYNSGANAIELAANVYKARPIILLGFDCSLRHGVHHHGKHAKTKNPHAERVSLWGGHFAGVAKKIGKTPVFNCSRYTELDMFPRRDLREMLCELGLTSATPMTKGRGCSNVA